MYALRLLYSIQIYSKRQFQIRFYTVLQYILGYEFWEGLGISGRSIINSKNQSEYHQFSINV